MRILKGTWLLLAMCAALNSTADSSRADELNEAKFREIQELIWPESREPWQTIPWQTSLLDAQKLAAREKKPIFIWAMDGHPLGCT